MSMPKRLPPVRPAAGRLLPVLVLLTAFPALASAANYYVAKNGSNNNPGTEALPWLTIQKAANTLAAGDTVYVKTGTYNERVSINVQGSAGGGYITFRNYGSDTVVLDGTGFNTGSPWGGLIQAIGKSYIRIQGFHVQNVYGGSNGGSIVVTGDTGASHIEILDNEVTAHDGGNAIGVRGSNFSYITVDNNEVHHCTTSSQEAIRVDKGTSYFKLTNNRVHDNSNIGIDCVGWGVQPAYGLIKGNICYNNGISSGGAHAIYIDGGTYITIEDNILYENQGGISVGAEYTGEVAHHIIVRRNVLYGGEVKGFTLGGSGVSNGRAENCMFVNNTLYNNNTGSWSGEFDVNYFQGTCVFKNNIIYDTDTASVYLVDNRLSSNPENLLLDYNDYFPANAWLAYISGIYHSLTSWQAATGQDTHSIALDPLFKDAAHADFQLLTNSPCKDAGDFLTRTLSAGSGTAIPVADARPFCDGYGGFFSGDLIQVGGQNPVRIVQVNYATNVITVNQVLSWAAGDGVSLPYSGSRPDIGAYEFGAVVYTGTVSGIVSDQSTYAVITGANVAASGYTAFTDSQGAYSLLLPAGNHAVSVSKNGYLAQSRTIDVVFGTTTSLDWQLVEIESSGETGETHYFTVQNPTCIKGKSSSQYVFFGNLPREATIKIYTLDGKGVKTIVHRSGADYGSETWDTSDAASGIYIYCITSPQGEKKGKLAVIK